MGFDREDTVEGKIDRALKAAKEIKGDSRSPGNINVVINSLERAKFLLKLRG